MHMKHHKKEEAPRDYKKLAELLSLADNAVINAFELAALLDCGYRSLERICRRHGFPSPLTPFGHRKWRLGDIRHWIEGRTNGGAQASARSPILDAMAPQARDEVYGAQRGRSAKPAFLFSVVSKASDAAEPLAILNCSWADFTRSLGSPSVRGSLPLQEYLHAARSPIAAERSAARRLKDGRAWIPAIFGQHLNEEGNHRHAANVMACTALALDIDNKPGAEAPLSLGEVVNQLPAGIALAWHSTYSNSNDCPRFRVIVPWGHCQDTTTTLLCFDALNARLGDRLDAVSRNPASIFFEPSCPPDALPLYRCGERSGRLADPADFLDVGRAR